MLNSVEQWSLRNFKYNHRDSVASFIDSDSDKEQLHIKKYNTIKDYIPELILITLISIILIFLMMVIIY